MNRYARIALLIVIALLSIGFASASVYLDDFNRANSATVGGNWTESEAGTGYFSINTSSLYLFAPSTSHTTDNIYTDLSTPSNITIAFVNFTSAASKGIELYLKTSAGLDIIDVQINNGVIQVRTSDTVSTFVTVGTYVNGDNFNLTFADLKSDGGDSLSYDVWVNNTKVDNDRIGYWDNGASIGRLQFSMINPWTADLRINEVCVDSTKTYCETPSSGLDNFTVTAQDAYTAASITGFNVTFEDLGITTTQTSYNQTTNFGTSGTGLTVSGATYNTTTWAYDFDGINDYINISSALAASITDTTGTIAGWVSIPDGTPASPQRFFSFTNSGINSYLIFAADTSGKLSIPMLLSGSGKWTVTTDNQVFFDNTLTHIALVHNGTAPTIYINGVAVAQTISVTTDQTQWFSGSGFNTGRIGNVNFNGGGEALFLKGTVSSFVMYDTALNSTEMQYLYNNTKISTQPTTRYEFINFSTEPSTFDYSGQGTTATFAGTTYNSTGENMNFNGVNNYIDFNNDSRFDLQTFTIVYEITPYNLGARRDLISKGESSYITSIQASGVPNMWVYDGSYRSLAGTSTFSNGQRQWVAYRYDKANAVYDIWVNGTEENSADPTAYNALSNNAVNLSFGTKTVTAPTNYFNGLAHQIIIYDYDLSNDELTQLYTTNKTNTTPLFKYTFQNSTVGDVTVNGIPNYFGNTTINVNTSNTFASKHTRFPEALFYDAYTGLNITSFNVTINSTTYTTTNGSLYIPYKDLIGVSSATKYFQASNTISNRTEYLAHYASITGFNAYDKVSGLNVSTFTVNTTSEGGSATNTSYLPSLYTTYGNFTGEYNKAGYYRSWTTYEANPQTSQEANFTVYNHKANFTITIGIGGSTSNNFTIDIYDRNNYSYHEQRSTTNGHVTFNLSHGNYTAVINDTVHTLTYYNFTLQETNNRSNFTITTYTTNTVNITFIDEETNRIITLADQNASVTAYITGSQASYNFTVNNGSLLAEMINPQDYTITYSATGYGQREKHFTLTNRTYEYLTLYLLNESNEDLILFTVRDAIGTNIENATVRAQRKNLSGTNYYEVDNCLTGGEGTCTMRLILYDPTYRFVVDYNDATVKTTGDQKITSTSVVITVDLTTDELAQIAVNLNMTGNISYNNNTQTFSFTYNNPAGTNVEGCLTVTARKAGIYTTLNTNCQTGTSSGTLTYVINESRYDEFTANAYIENRLVATLGIVTGGFGTGSGANGLFIFGFFILGTLAMAMLWNPIAAPVVLVGGLALFSFAGVISVPLASIGGLIALVIGFIALSNR